MKVFRFSAVALAAAMLTVAACAPIPATTTATPQTATTAAPAATETVTPQPTGVAATLLPPAAEVCNGIAQVMTQALPGVEVTQATEPVAINDVASGASGTACRASATGTGETFKSPIDTVQAITKLLAAGGWTEDMNLIADGPTGTATGFRSGNQLCLVGADWNPGPAVSCPADKPISECNVPLNQQIYEVTVDCATSGS